MYIFTITYNFDTDSVVRKCETEEEAFKTMRKYLNEEIKTIKNESEYEPSVLRFAENDIVLVYASGYKMNGLDRTYALEDCAYYRIFEV